MGAEFVLHHAETGRKERCAIRVDHGTAVGQLVKNRLTCGDIRGGLHHRKTLLRIALDPGRADYRNNLGVVFRSLGRVGEAALAYREAIRLARCTEISVRSAVLL